MQNQISFEDSLRLSQVPQPSPSKKKDKEEKKNKIVQFQPDDVTDILNILSPLAQQGPKVVVKPKIAQGKLDFIFNPVRDITAQKPYFEDGDPQMLIMSKYYDRYTEESLEKRNRLRADQDIQLVINKVHYEIIMVKFMENYKFDLKEKLIKDEYILVQLKLADVLRDDLVEDENLDELRFTLNEDWEHDSLGKGFMNKADLFNSLFELVDTWTPDAEKDEYLGFFELISEKFQYIANNKIEQKFYEFIGENTL